MFPLIFKSNMLKFNDSSAAFVFIAFLDRSHWAEKECHLSLLKQTKIDRAKNTKVLLASHKKVVAKMRKAVAELVSWQN